MLSIEVVYARQSRTSTPKGFSFGPNHLTDGTPLLDAGFARLTAESCETTYFVRMA
jgi:hypothetical protein